MAKCETVRFRMQMKRGDRIYTGVAETFEMAMGDLLGQLRLRPHSDDMDVMLQNIRETVKVMTDVDSELGGMFELLDKIKELEDLQG